MIKKRVALYLNFHREFSTEYKMQYKQKYSVLYLASKASALFYFTFQFFCCRILSKINSDLRRTK